MVYRNPFPLSFEQFVQGFRIVRMDVFRDEFLRCHPEVFPEGTGEVGRGGEPHAVGHFGDVHLVDKVNISEVAYRVGFSTPSYFSSSFREYFGMTPKEFVSKYIHSDDPEALDKLFKG